METHTTHAGSTRLMAGLAIGAAILLAMVSWALKPNPSMEAFTVIGLPLMWWWLERGPAPVDPERAAARLRLAHMGLTAFATMTMLDTGPELAIYTGLVGQEWLPTVQRSFGIVWGLMLLVMGNYVPKVWRVACRTEPGDGQRSARFTGWAMVLTGLAAISIWVLLPEPMARFAMLGLTVVMVAAFVGRRLFAAPSESGGGATG